MPLKTLLATSSATLSLRHALQRLAVAIIACVMVVLILSVLVAWGGDFFSSTSSLAPSPFGMGLRENAPSGEGWAKQLFVWQSGFYQGLTQALSQLSQTGGMSALIGLSFAYGVFHAAGPGHGKAVIAAFMLASEQQYRRGLSLSFAAAILQALVAIVLVTFLALILNMTSRHITQTAHIIEQVSFAVMMGIGAWILWQRTARMVELMGARLTSKQMSQANTLQTYTPHVCASGCSHGDKVMIKTLQYRKPTAVQNVGVVLSAGLRPCMGAIVVLIFALSQHQFIAGVWAALAMALGTALTTGAMASIAVFAKSFAQRFSAQNPNGKSAFMLSSLELLSAAFLVVLGSALLKASSF
jgi:nickel/cobalt transporter (NicO) family protein